jgi:hypothetical protein
MSNENKPDWNDLQNEQAETNAWQIDRIWMTAKKLPVYFWVLTILLTATMLNTLRLHYVMQDIKSELSASTNAEVSELKAAKKGMRSRVLESQKSVNTLVDRLAIAESERDDLRNEIAGNRTGYLMARETNLICIGLAKDDPSMLKQAEVIQTKRTGEPFSICKWKNMETLATTIVYLNAIHCAKWVTLCENWKKAVPAEFHDYLTGLALESDKKNFNRL